MKKIRVLKAKISANVRHLKRAALSLAERRRLIQKINTDQRMLRRACRQKGGVA